MRHAFTFCFKLLEKGFSLLVKCWTANKNMLSCFRFSLTQQACRVNVELVELSYVSPQVVGTSEKLCFDGGSINITLIRLNSIP